MDEQKPPLYPREEQYYMGNNKITPPPSRKAFQLVSAALAVVIVIAIVLGMLVFHLATTQVHNSNPLVAVTVASSPSPQIGNTPTIQPTPIPTVTPVPTATSVPVSPTPTPLLTGVSDCSGGLSVGWKKWSSNPANAWNDYGATIVSTTDTSSSAGPTLIGPPCGLLQRGSRVTIVFKGAGGSVLLYLMVQGTDMQGLHWYAIDLGLQGLRIDRDGNVMISQGASLNKNQNYTYTMEMATDGNLNLLDGNGGVILQAPLSFTPNGQWGLSTFNGSFSVSSVVVH